MTIPVAVRTLLNRPLLGRQSVVLVAVLLIICEFIVVYGFAPGRLKGAGVQPDSVSYVCYGLSLGEASSSKALELSGKLFDQFGALGLQVSDCSSFSFISTLYPRLLLPGLIAGVSHLGIPQALVLPSILIYMAFASLWLWIVLAGLRTISVRIWLRALAPLAAFTLVLPLVAVLTEGPLVLAFVAAVAVLAGWTKLRKRWRLIVILVLGGVMLITRQSWPIVGPLWGAALIPVLAPVVVRNPHLKAKAAGLVAVSVVVSTTVAGLINWTLTSFTLPDGTSPDYYAREGELFDFVSIAILAINSTADDFSSALHRGDLLSIAVFLWSLAGLVVLTHHRAWLVLMAVAPTWVFGAYQTGLVVLDQGTVAVGTNYRYYLPAIFGTLAAGWIISDRKMPSQTGDTQSPNYSHS